MTRTARRIVASVGIGALTLVVLGAAYLISSSVFCPAHRALVRVASDRSAMVLDVGVRVARPDDAIFVCETPHTVGPLALHTDLQCYCAPRTMTVEALGARLGGSCRIDKLDPTRSDTFGACRFARCSFHVDP